MYYSSFDEASQANDSRRRKSKYPPAAGGITVVVLPGGLYKSAPRPTQPIARAAGANEFPSRAFSWALSN